MKKVKLLLNVYRTIWTFGAMILFMLGMWAITKGNTGWALVSFLAAGLTIANMVIYDDKN